MSGFYGVVVAHPLYGNPLDTRADQVEAVRRIFEPLVPRFSPGGARVDLGPRGSMFGVDAVQLEGFARPLWAVASLAPNGDGFDHWDLYRRGLASGVDPDHPDYWGTFGDGDQRMVEQGTIGYALAVAGNELWDPLDERTREQLVDWLHLINRHEPFGNNWQFFRVMVNLGLQRVGAEADAAATERSLQQLDEMYDGDGWYHDGALAAYDLYIACAFHFYGLLYASMADDDWAARYRERASAFASDWAAWFDDRGDVVPFGRSLTYRFVAGSFWSALAVADVEALPWGEVKGLLHRHLRRWADRPIFGNDGVLTVGYGYENGAVGEEYISAGSPYWAMKPFVALAAPADHAIWSAEEQPNPGDHGVSSQAVPALSMMRTCSHVVALSVRHSGGFFVRGEARYAKFAYSSRYGFSLPCGADGPHQLGSDSMLALWEGHGGWRVRTQVTDWGVEDDDLLWTTWSPWPDVSVRTVLWAAPPWHLRLHLIETGRSLVTAEGGFAIGDVGAGAMAPPVDRKIDEHEASVTSASDHSRVIDPSGGRAGFVYAPLPNTNVFEPRTLLPALTGSIEPGRHELVGFYAAGDVAEDELRVDPPDIPGRVRELVRPGA